MMRDFQLGLYVPHKSGKTDYRKWLKYGIYGYVLPFNEKREHPCGYSLGYVNYDVILQIEYVRRHFLKGVYKKISFEKKTPFIISSTL